MTVDNEELLNYLTKMAEVAIKFDIEFYVGVKDEDLTIIYLNYYVGDREIVNDYGDTYFNKGLLASLRICKSTDSYKYYGVKNVINEIELRNTFIFPHINTQGQCCTGGENQLNDISNLITDRKLAKFANNNSSLTEEDYLLDAMFIRDCFIGYFTFESLEGSAYYSLQSQINMTLLKNDTPAENTINENMLRLNRQKSLYNLGSVIDLLIKDKQTNSTLVKYILDCEIPIPQTFEELVNVGKSIYDSFNAGEIALDHTAVFKKDIIEMVKNGFSYSYVNTNAHTAYDENIAWNEYQKLVHNLFDGVKWVESFEMSDELITVKYEKNMYEESSSFKVYDLHKTYQLFIFINSIRTYDYI